MCNGSTPDSDSVCGGSNPSSPAKKENHTFWCGFSFLGNGYSMRDSNPERVSGVKKMCRWHIFSREVRSSYAARTDGTWHCHADIIPHPLPKRKPHHSVCFSFLGNGYSRRVKAYSKRFHGSRPNRVPSRFKARMVLKPLLMQTIWDHSDMLSLTFLPVATTVPSDFKPTVV